MFSVYIQCDPKKRHLFSFYCGFSVSVKVIVKKSSTILWPSVYNDSFHYMETSFFCSHLLLSVCK